MHTRKLGLLDKKEIQSAMKLLSIQCHHIAEEKGFWNKTRNQGELIALMHSELSEALEYLRHGNPLSDHIPEFTGVEEELADLIIRVMDMAGAYGYRIPEAIIAKLEFNATREHMHGKKF